MNLFARFAAAAGRACAVALVGASTSLWAAGLTCPNAKSGKNGFVVERSARQTTEVFHLDNDVVATTRYDGQTVLETVQYQGLFQLDRIDRGRRVKYEPRTDLNGLFPLTVGRSAIAKFITNEAGREGQLQVEFTVRAEDDIIIGSCKYRVLKLDRKESRSNDSPRHINIDYYSPDLKLILAREYRERDGRTTLIKYDRIYQIKK
jgi:hypothetical protein